MPRSAKQIAALRKAQLASIRARAAKATPESRQARRERGAQRRLEAAYAKPASKDSKAWNANANSREARKGVVKAQKPHAKGVNVTGRKVGYSVTNTSGQTVRTGNRMHAQAIKQGYYQW